MTTSIENCECRYFTSYSGVKLPLKMVNQLTEAVPENRNTYFRAYFDAEGRLIQCQKLVYGEIELQHRYTYYANHMLSQAEITDVDGEVTVLNFTEPGEALSD
jgi:hypothetical protein